MNLVRGLKKYSLVIAMLAGIFLWQPLSYLSFLIPFMIFGMLFFTFVKISPASIRLAPTHMLIMVLQVILAILFYIIFNPLNAILAQGFLICFLAPAATASSVVIGILNGDIGYGTAYVLLSHILIAFIGPVIFSYIDYVNLPFWQSVYHIFSGIIPLIIVPLLLAWIIKGVMPKISNRLFANSKLPYWFWITSLSLILAKTVKYIANQPDKDVALLILLCIVGLVSAVIQFYLGNKIGTFRVNRDTVTTRQSFGQKNTSLAIWMALSYLNPLCSIAPASYVIWQNLFNSYQIYQFEKKNNKL